MDIKSKYKIENRRGLFIILKDNKELKSFKLEIDALTELGLLMAKNN